MRDPLAELAAETAEHENTKHAYRQALALALAMAAEAERQRGEAQRWHGIAERIDKKRSELAHADATRDQVVRPIPQPREAA